MYAIRSYYGKQFIEAPSVDAQSVFLGEEVGQVERKSEGIVELEDIRAVDDVDTRRFRVRDDLFENLQSAIESGIEAFFFRASYNFV